MSIAIEDSCIISYEVWNLQLKGQLFPEISENFNLSPDIDISCFRKQGGYD